MLAGKFGLRRSLAVAAVLMMAGILLAAVSQWYWMLLAVLIIAGLGEGLVEGLATPFVGALHKDDEPGRYMNFSHGFWSVGIFCCIPVLGWLLGMNVSWRILCLVVAAVTLIPAFMLFFPGRKRLQRLEGTGSFDAAGAVRNMREILKSKHFWLFFAAMFVAGGGEFGMTFWCAALLRLEYHAAPFTGALATAVFSAGMMLGRTGSGIFIKQYQLPRLIMIMSFAGALICLLFYCVSTIAGVMILLFFAGLASAPFWPSVQSYSVDRLNKLDSTTLYILLSCAGVPGCGVLSVVMGKVGDLWGLRAAFMVVPVCYLILFILIASDYFALGGRKAMRQIKHKNQSL
jgi:fucose permease